MLRQILERSASTRDRILGGKEQVDVSAGRDNVMPRALFVCCIALYVCYLLLTEPDWIIGGGMWAEMATNYFPNAGLPFPQVLVATDSGYVPFLLRVVALVGAMLKLSAAAIPYYYSWIAILLTGAMAGAFCLAPFRVLIWSDSFRFLVSICALLIAGFEIRTFINFTYYAVFFTACVTALALAQREHSVPWWAWFVPLLALSKPAMLTVLPAMTLVALVSHWRFRLITAVSLLLMVFQIATMNSNHAAGTFRAVHHASLGSKLQATGSYFFGLLGHFLGGIMMPPGMSFYLILAGVCFLGLIAIPLVKWRSNANALILVGLSLLLFNVFLNAFVLSDMWNKDLALLDVGPGHRHIIVGFFGILLIMAGVFGWLCGGYARNLPVLLRPAGAVAFGAWFFFSGWLGYAGMINRYPSSPLLSNSQWVNMAELIDSGKPVCVPVDPLGWMLERGCQRLDPKVEFRQWGKPTGLAPAADALTGKVRLALPVPPVLAGKELLSLAVLARLQSGQRGLLGARAELARGSGSSSLLSAGRELPAAGGLLFFTGAEFQRMDTVRTVTLEFDAPVELGMGGPPGAEELVVLWMGR
jgi:hypothetical protein